MDYVSSFNKIFLEFLQDLISVFPSDAEFRGNLLAVKTGLLLNNKIVCNVFYTHFLCYEEQVFQRDERFFLDKDYSEISSSRINIHQFLQKLKAYWPVLTEDNKDTIWQYFKVLMTLTRKIYNTHTTL